MGSSRRNVNLGDAALFSAIPFAAALNEAEDFITSLVWDENRVRQGELHWTPESGSSMQSALLKFLGPARQALKGLTRGHIKDQGDYWVVADWRASVVNRMLVEMGYTIQLSPWPLDRQTFGFAGGVTFDWERKAPSRGIYSLTPYVPGYLLRVHEGMDIFNYEGRPLVRVSHGGGKFTLWCKVGIAAKDFNLLALAQKILSGAQRPALYEYDAVLFPTWEIPMMTPDIRGLRGLSTVDAGNNLWELTQALYQGEAYSTITRDYFRAAVAMAATREGHLEIENPPAGTYLFDEDLVEIWFKDGKVLAVAYVPVKNFSQTLLGD